MSSNKKITEIFRAMAEGVTAVTGSCSFVFHWGKKNSEKYLYYCVKLTFSHQKMLFELKLLSEQQRIYGCGSPERVLNTVMSPVLTKPLLSHS